MFFSATADAQGFAYVLDATKNRGTMMAEEQDLDDVQNKAMCPMLLTPEAQAIALELEKSDEKSQKVWKGVEVHFKTSVSHKMRVALFPREHASGSLVVC